ncbi:MAG: DUF2867 domain-containing protein [Actinomycetales bacterium]|nr:DUF2867 domain-containing protein [Actinomycetales bacterium]
MSRPVGKTPALTERRATRYPATLSGRLYWFSILPFHGIIFNGMAKSITAAAAKRFQNSRAA